MLGSLPGCVTSRLWVMYAWSSQRNGPQNDGQYASTVSATMTSVFSQFVIGFIGSSQFEVAHLLEKFVPRRDVPRLDGLETVEAEALDVEAGDNTAVDDGFAQRVGIN